MDIKFIVRDSLKYPLSDWKKILILGIILFISSYVITDNIITIRNIAEMGLLGIIGLMFGLLAYGYAFRIIKTSLLGIVELPAFDDWVNMFLVGLKVLVVGIVYLIPVILFIIFSAVSSPSTFTLTYGSTGLTVVGIFLEVLESVIIQGIGNLAPILFNISMTTIWGSITIVYMILIIPTIAIAIANMANNNSKISAAFKFHEIINKISNIGWENLIIWYIITGILYLILLALSNIFPIGQGLMLLIVIPCFYMYLARSVALLYTSNKL
ncbi:DUF4013 domain-containing protein [Methanobacterium aggregans]|uniref:DUF4013 domain-containing protein n=2 Tax=Methanobacterium aggregans TaxID=1615586 RepID=UPI00320CEAE2